MQNGKWGLRVAVVGVLGFFGLMFLLSRMTVVETGFKGVVLDWGSAREELINEGLFIRPVGTKVVDFDVRTNKLEIVADAGTVDLQPVNIKIAISYSIPVNKVLDVYREYGLDYVNTVISPKLEESVKLVSAVYTADTLLARRDEFGQKLLDKIKSGVAGENIIVSDVNVVDFAFDKRYMDAVVGKQVAIQDAMAAKNRLEQVKSEAEQKVATAKADAEAIRLQSDAANNDKYVELMRLEVQKEYARNWDGKLPVNMYGNGAVPFIDVK